MIASDQTNSAKSEQLTPRNFHDIPLTYKYWQLTRKLVAYKSEIINWHKVRCQHWEISFCIQIAKGMSSDQPAYVGGLLNIYLYITLYVDREAYLLTRYSTFLWARISIDYSPGSWLLMRERDLGI